MITHIVSNAPRIQVYFNDPKLLFAAFRYFFEMVPEITGSPQQLPTSHNSPLLSSHSADNEQISPPVFSDFIIKDLPHNIKSMVSPYNDIQIVFSIK